MKFSILIAAFLSASSLFGIEPTNAQLQKALIKTTLAESETQKARTEIIKIREELAVEIANRDEEAAKRAEAEAEMEAQAQKILEKNSSMHISVIGQGVAPMNTSSPAQAYALAKRAAIADAYRAIAEKVKGVHIDGQDLIKNMMVKRSTIRTSVKAMVRNANIVETTFKEGLCEVEMEIIISHSDFAQ
ncbi:MAG: LPP20 family lipoprotein [Sulfurimonas sp.]|nr:LPP20 family lipoprotein [Sulfurimonas sp.]